MLHSRKLQLSPVDSIIFYEILQILQILKNISGVIGDRHLKLEARMLLIMSINNYADYYQHFKTDYKP